MKKVKQILQLFKQEMHNRSTRLRIVVTAVLFVVLVAGSSTVLANISTGVGSNTYALVVKTGTKNGEYIGTFMVEYKDAEGNLRRAYINPHDGDYVDSLKLAARAINSSDSEHQRQKIVHDTFGYEADWWSTHSDSSRFDGMKALQSFSTDTYFFDTYYPVKEVVKISVMTEVTMGKRLCDWDCYGIDVYKVQSINGIGMMGYVSNQFYVKFKGTRMASVEYVPDVVNSNSPMAFQFTEKGVQPISQGVKEPATEGNHVMRTKKYGLVTGWEDKKSVEFDNTKGTDKYYFNISIADIYKAGLEQYMAGSEAKSIKDLNLAELIVLDLVYFDMRGMQQHVATPVLLSSLASQIEQGVITADTKLAAVVPQGGTITVPLELPGFNPDAGIGVGNIKLKCVQREKKENSNDENVIDMKYDCGIYSNKEAVHNAFYDSLGTTGDQIIYKGIQIYSAAKVVPKTTLVNRAYLRTTFGNVAPVLYEAASTKQGIALSRGNTIMPKLRPYQGGELYLAQDGFNYIVAVKTADLQSAGTTSDVTVAVSYKDKTGGKQTKVVNLRDACHDFYGYWPDDTGADYAYEFNMLPGATMYVPVSIANVNYFTGVEFSIRGKDDWVIAGYTLYDYESLGELSYSWLKGTMGYNNVNTCVAQYRLVDGDIMTPKAEKIDAEQINDKELTGEKEQLMLPVNVDTDGDGKPDKNIDTNGDGKPDTNVDTDGDGKPDKNIDTDGDGKPDTNIDRDGDGRPDTNIDRDGDGKPDTNIDTDGDGKPDTNIDRDGDGRPDTNIDRDGDGKPDTNIDTNIDTDIDGKPDRNDGKENEKQIIPIDKKNKNPIVNIDLEQTRTIVGGSNEFDQNSFSLDFTSPKVEKKRNKVDIFEHLYSLSYEKATDYLGFDEAQIHYQVTVDVAAHTGLQTIETNETLNLNHSDDCGSENYFYFQLIFENGSSGFVQANQQLPADGFRTGTEASFVIDVNRDYGDVEAIYIIPETDPNYGSPYDKLKINQIKVSRALKSGLTENYVFSDIGWIGFAYEQESVQGKTHMKGEIAQCYTVSKKTTSAQVQFAITYDLTSHQVPSDSEKANRVADETDPFYEQLPTVPFIGKLGMEVIYHPLGSDGKIDPEKADKKWEGDVVRLMKIFNGEALDIQQSNQGLDSYESSPKTMIRSGKTDRFLWTAEDVQYIKSVRLLYTNHTGDTIVLKVKSLGLNLVTNADNLSKQTNENDEKILFDDETLSVPVFPNLGYWEADDDSDSDGRLELKSSSEQYLDFPISDINETAIANLQSSMPTTPYKVKRDPSTKDDTFNIYVYTSENQKNNIFREGSPKPIRVKIDYADVYGQYIESAQYSLTDVLTVDEQKGKYVYAGMDYDASDMSILRAARAVQAATKGNEVISIDHIMVQHVRQGIIIGNYICKFLNTPVPLSLEQKTATVSKLTTGSNVKQEVTIKMNSAMEKQIIVPEVYDVAIALQYESAYDVHVGSKKQYYTAYKFLSDFGYTSIEPDGVYNIEFNEFGVSNIVGVKLAATNSMKVTIDAITVGCYEGKRVDASQQTQVASATTPETQQVAAEAQYEYSLADNQWYVFETTESNNLLVNQAKLYTMNLAPRDGVNTYSPITIRVKMMENHPMINNVGLSDKGSVNLLIHYKEPNGTERSITVPNVQNRLEKGSFRAGDTAVLKLMLQGIPGINKDAITSLVILPYDNDGDNATRETLGIASIGIDYGGGYSYAPLNIGVNDVVVELLETEATNEMMLQSDTIYVKEIILKADVYKEYLTESLSITSKTEGTVDIKDGESFKLSILSNGDYMIIAPPNNHDIGVTQDERDKTLYTVAYKNTNDALYGSTVTEKLLIVSAVNQKQQLALTINITIPPKAVVKTPDDTSSDASKDTQTPGDTSSDASPDAQKPDEETSGE